jgi:hypothetical protein
VCKVEGKKIERKKRWQTCGNMSWSEGRHTPRRKEMLWQGGDEEKEDRPRDEMKKARWREDSGKEDRDWDTRWKATLTCGSR